MSINVDELNYLIRRHLQEAGYYHTAYVFGTESMLEEAKLDDIRLPPQALITILQKGMLYMQLEKGINQKAKNDNDPESIISSILEDVHHEEAIPIQHAAPRSHPLQSMRSSANLEPINLTKNAALCLQGHSNDVYCSSWSPDGRFLATGSADATTLIWELSNNRLIKSYICDHATQENRTNKDIASMAWNHDSSLLATGCIDGSTRIWTNQGELKHVLLKHTDGVLAIQFSPNGQYLLTGSADGKTIVWSVPTGEELHVYSEHETRVISVAWRDDTRFASSSGDSKIIICFNPPQTHSPIVLTGHKSEVNEIQWDYTKQYLASCSDDHTVRVWRPFSTSAPIILSDHTDKVFAVKWAPNQNRLLASGSFDGTVRLWDIQMRKCVSVLLHHLDVFTISFSPKGKYIVSGGKDQKAMVWRTSDGTLLATYPSENSPIFDLQWDPTGQSISICATKGTVTVLPTSNIPTCQE